MFAPEVLIAFGLTLFAGLATTLGSALTFFSKHTNTKFLSVALGFSAGVMIYVSFKEILPKAIIALTPTHGTILGNWLAVIAFFGGMGIIALIDKFIPSLENPHEIHHIEELKDKQEAKRVKKLFRMGLFVAVAITIHNFPEGLVTFLAAIQDPILGISIAVAIAIHNIPEGMAVAIPIYHATKSKKKAFFYSFLSGLAEPIGALIGYFLLIQFFSDTLFGLMFAGVGGIMVFISLDQLLPTAEQYGEHHLCIYGLVAGMVVMAISLLLFL